MPRLAKLAAGAGPMTDAKSGTSPTISSGPAAQMGNRISLKKQPIVASAAVMCTIITMGKTIEPSHQKLARHTLNVYLIQIDIEGFLYLLFIWLSS